MFDKWEKAQATVIERKWIGGGSSADNVASPDRYAYVVEVPVSGGQPFRAEVHDPIIRTISYRSAGVAGPIGVLVDFKHQKAKLDTDDPSRHVKVQSTKGEINKKFDSALAGPPGSQDETSGYTKVVDAIRVLDQKRAAGTITPDQYRAARAQLARKPDPVTQAQDVSPATPAAAPAADMADELAKLADLKTQGLLTDAEFAAAKQKLLGT